jgi:hypothetical protein
MMMMMMTTTNLITSSRGCPSRILRNFVLCTRESGHCRTNGNMMQHAVQRWVVSTCDFFEAFVPQVVQDFAEAEPTCSV